MPSFKNFKEQHIDWFKKLSKLFGDAVINQSPPKQKKVENKNNRLQEKSYKIIQIKDQTSKSHKKKLSKRRETYISNQPNLKAINSRHTDLTLSKAWQAFKMAWIKAGLDYNYFTDIDELNNNLNLFDETFKETLIKWLLQIQTKQDILKNLARIIERGHIKQTDNQDAIKAFSYLKIAIRTNNKLNSEDDDSSLISLGEKVHDSKSFQTKENTRIEIKDIPKEINVDQSVKQNTGIRNSSLEELEISMRTYNSLRRAKINTLFDLAGTDEKTLIELKNFGPKAINEIKRVLRQRGLTLPFKKEEISNPQYSITKLEKKDEIDKSEQDNIESLDLTTRTLNCLYRARIFSVSELLHKSKNELLTIPNLGTIGLSEINTSLKAKKLSLEDDQLLLDKSKEEQVIEDAWQQLKQIVEEQRGLSELNYEQLMKLCTIHSNNIASTYLSEILYKLKATLGFIDDTISEQNEKLYKERKQLLEILRDYIATKLLKKSRKNSNRWMNQITNSIKQGQERNWQVYLKHCSGKTLAAIAKEQSPPVSRERIRQMENKITKIVGIKPADLVTIVQERKIKQQKAVEIEVLESWIKSLGRLPIRKDLKDELINQSKLWDQVCMMNLIERISLLNKHNLIPSSKEYDYHYEYIVNKEGDIGSSYWRDFENLKQFVLRHANKLGEPTLMPKQTSFPRRVGAIVGSHGGQGKVAELIGLKYQGQLIGSNGRTYWTDEFLNQLLLDTNIYFQQDTNLMPSNSQVFAFFKGTKQERYQGKKPGSAIAALTKGDKLHWSEVAKRFDKRFISGESQKAVTAAYIKAFVRDLGEHLDSLSPSELFVLFQAQGINRGEKEVFSRTFDPLVNAVQSGVIDKDELRSWAENNNVESVQDLIDFGTELKAKSSQENKEHTLLEYQSKKLQDKFSKNKEEKQISPSDLPTYEPKNILKALDKAGNIIDNSAKDSDKIEFLKAKATAKLWDQCFKDEKYLINRIKSFSSHQDSYSQEVKTSFIEEYEGAKALPIPSTYSFRDLYDKPRDPKLMQRLVAYRLKRDKRLLNLSGTGTGKTLSAIYAAQICNSKRIFITCPNGVINSWLRAFESAFPSANLIVKPDRWSLTDNRKEINVVIMNFEQFQDVRSDKLRNFCVDYEADLIVIDEIHQSKSRTSETTSQRRKLINEFIHISSNKNTDLRVLGMSATPVINNLFEGKSLLELIRQQEIKNVEETIDMNSCMNLYQHFVVNGIRMNPGQLSRTKQIKHEVDATNLLPEIVNATKRGRGGFHDIEQLLVKPKLSTLKDILVHGKKTVIFITYLKNTINPITRWLNANNFSYSVYTGDQKEATEEGFRDSLDEFINGNSDILVATIQCAATGIDGLQKVCSRAVFFQLPWTSTEYEQAIGRLDRDGTYSDSISVHIPITDIKLPDGQHWSWCNLKLNRIESKRDIAKAAVDGEIPEDTNVISPEKAGTLWLNWLKKLDQKNK